MGSKPKVLFVCTGNSCRSQMAEGWARHFWEQDFDVYSAGVSPHRVDPRAIFVMEEVGVDISGHWAKHVDEFKHLEFDLVITVCDYAKGQCPVFPGETKRHHVGFDDPPSLAFYAKTEEEALGYYRRIRDQIKSFVERLPDVIKEQTGKI